MSMDWLRAFLVRHKLRFDPPDWPSKTDPDGGAGALAFIQDWADALGRIGATEAEAHRASSDLILDPPRYRRDHIPAVVAKILIHRGGPAPVLPRLNEEAEASARSTWEDLPEVERDRLLALVRERFPELAHRAWFVETMAIAWHLNPGAIPPARDAEPVQPGRRPRVHAWSTGQPEPDDAGTPGLNTPEPPVF